MSDLNEELFYLKHFKRRIFNLYECFVSIKSMIKLFFFTIFFSFPGSYFPLLATFR